LTTKVETWHPRLSYSTQPTSSTLASFLQVVFSCTDQLPKTSAMNAAIIAEAVSPDGDTIIVVLLMLLLLCIVVAVVATVVLGLACLGAIAVTRVALRKHIQAVRLDMQPEHLSAPSGYFVPNAAPVAAPSPQAAKSADVLYVYRISGVAVAAVGVVLTVVASAPFFLLVAIGIGISIAATPLTKHRAVIPPGPNLPQ
jgi:hypothetical protein